MTNQSQHFRPDIGIQMYEGGFTLTEIADASGITYDGVRYNLLRHHQERYRFAQKLRQVEAAIAAFCARPLKDCCCTTCGKRFLWWPKRGPSRLGKRQFCSACYLDALQARSRSHIRAYAATEKGRRKMREWQAANPEKTRGYSDKWYEKNKELLSAKSKHRYHTDPEYRERALRENRERRRHKKAAAR